MNTVKQYKIYDAKLKNILIFSIRFDYSITHSAPARSTCTNSINLTVYIHFCENALLATIFCLFFFL